MALHEWKTRTMTQRKLKKLVETDLMQLKLLLKLRMASYSTIKQKEQQSINHFHNIWHSAKTIEKHLRRELKLIEKLRKKAEKEHKQKRWNGIRKVLKHELQEFNENLRKGKNFVQSCTHLNKRLNDFQQTMKTAKRKTLKQHELTTIHQFIK